MILADPLLVTPDNPLFIVVALGLAGAGGYLWMSWWRRRK